MLLDTTDGNLWSLLITAAVFWTGLALWVFWRR